MLGGEILGELLSLHSGWWRDGGSRQEVEGKDEEVVEKDGEDWKDLSVEEEG